MTATSEQHSKTTPREFDPGEDAHGTEVPWFDASPKSIDPSTRRLLTTYSGIPDDRVEQHIVDVVSTLSTLSPHRAFPANSIFHSEIGRSRSIPILAWDSFDSSTLALASRHSTKKPCDESRLARRC